MKFPVVIQATVIFKGYDKDKPTYEDIVYNELEYNNVVDFYKNAPKAQYHLTYRKPKIKELTKYNFWEKLSYLIPFQTQISDMIVDAVKVTVGFILGLVLAKYVHL